MNTKKLYMVSSDNCLFFVYSDLSPEEIEKAYLTDLNSRLFPKSYYNVTVTDIKTVNHIRYKGQPVYSVKKADENIYCYDLYLQTVIRNGYKVITGEDLK